MPATRQSSKQRGRTTRQQRSEPSGERDPRAMEDETCPTSPHLDTPTREEPDDPLGDLETTYQTDLAELERLQKQVEHQKVKKEIDRCEESGSGSV